MTTPLGAIEVGPREGRRVTVARSTRETEITVTLGLDGAGHTAIDTGIGFYDHLLGSLAHHGLFDLADPADGDLQVDEHHTVEDVALVLGAAFAEALGDRAGIARFGQSAVPMDESIATAVVDVGGRPYAVIDLPFRGERAGGLPLQLVEHALESFARTAGATLHLSRHRPQRPPPRRGRVQGPRPGAARRVRDRPAPRGRRLDQGQPRVSARPAPPHRRRRRLRRGQPRQHRPGARRRSAPTSRIARDAEALRGADALVVPGVGAAEPAMARLARARPDRADPRVAGRPIGRSSASASGSSSCSTAATRTARRPSASCPAGRSASRTRRPSPTSAGTRSSGRAPHPLFDGIADGRRLLLRPLVRRRARPSRRRRRRPGHDRARPPVRLGASRAARCSASSSTRSAAAADGLRLLANFVDLVRAA